MKIQLTNELKNEINNEIKKAEKVIDGQLQIIEWGFPLQADTDVIIAMSKGIQKNKNHLKRGYIA